MAHKTDITPNMATGALAMLSGLQVSDTALAIKPETPFEVRDRAAEILAEAEARSEAQRTRILWWIGDLLRVGTEDECIQLAGHFAPQTAKNVRYICGRIPPAVRRAGLTFSHHATVAALPVDAQDKLLSLAETKKLSRDDLREAVREIRHAVVPRATRLEDKLRNALATATALKAECQALEYGERERLNPLAAKVAGIYLTMCAKVASIEGSAT